MLELVGFCAIAFLFYKYLEAEQERRDQDNDK